jgi:hypothetical protein
MWIAAKHRQITFPAQGLAGRLIVVAVLAVTYFVTVMAVSAASSSANVGELGPPPAQSEIRQVLTDLYHAGQPPDFTVDVQFVGPILVGQPTVHPNPPPGPWCVPRPQPIQHGTRCGHPDPGSSPMYPVLALVSVTTTQGLVSSAQAPSSVVHTTSTTYDGKPCPEEAATHYCPTYFFYRDDRGNWQVA